MSYLVLARKYRPQVLQDVAGQDHIVQTLTNSILSGRIAQSFLFVGSRGVGKTSTARILAKILNCSNRAEGDVNPCNECDSCKEITGGTSMDVLEIDGASNRGIDEIRNLRENVKFKPSSGKYKVYIIDEVHMLTTEAFNALLKTLEEPPEHVKFIFATTEAHRVLPTIVSRCQRYDFRRIPTLVIVDTLKSVAEKEKLEVEDDALFAIAKAAEGGMRDAESVLDQLASYCGGKITLQDAEQVLGVTGDATYFDLIDAVSEKASNAALLLIQKIVQEGKDLRQFSKGLLEFFRDMLMVMNMDSPEDVIERMDDSLEQVKERASKFTQEELLYIISIMQNLINQIKYSTSPQIAMEVAVIKMTKRPQMQSVSNLLARMERLEKNGVSVSSGGTAVSRSRPASGSTGPAYSAQKKTLKTQAGIKSEPVSTGAAAKPVQIVRTDTSVHNATAVVEPEPVQAEIPAKSAKEAGVTIGFIGQNWQRVLEAVKRERMSVGVFLSEGEPLELEGDTLDVGFEAEFAFHKETLESVENKETVETVLSQVLGARTKIRFVLTENTANDHEVEGEPDKPVIDEHSKIIDDALDIFKGKTVRRG